MSCVVSLGMYDFPWLTEATDALWTVLRDQLQDGGLPAVPAALQRVRPLQAIWHDPDLLLAQTCGYPLLTELAGRVRLVATPCYAFPGCEGALHRSFVVVRAGEAAKSLAALRGRRCALNGRDSNTGMNLLRGLVAKLAGGQTFFSAVIETGAHLASIEAVRQDRADLASIDCVTYGLVKRYRPALLAGTRVLTQTAATPGLPLVTSTQTGAAELAVLRDALAATALHPAAAALGWHGVALLKADAYAPVLQIERSAEAAGYPLLT